MHWCFWISVPLFDTVDHSIMLQVLRDRFCVEGRALEWFESYLCDRTQTYQVEDQQSRPRKVDCGVPQGSVLGPQKFIAYTEDLAELIDEYCLNHHMYTQMIEQNTIPGIPRHHNETSKLHRSNSGMVQIATTSTESSKNRTDLVRVKGQSKEDGRS